MSPAVPKPKRYPKERFFKPRKIVRIEANPLEETEQKTVVDWLKAHKLLFTANVPDRRYCQRMGYSPGVPDILIFDRPLRVENGYLWIGAALEMKRRKGGVVSDEQQGWLDSLKNLGWITKVAYGCDDAIRWLEGLYL